VGREEVAVMKLNPATFREKLQACLWEAAQAAQEGSARQAQYLLGASLLEQGRNCPDWIADGFVPRAWQDAYGAAAMLNGMSRIEIESIYSTCIDWGQR
jgi:hypothetical protein